MNKSAARGLFNRDGKLYRLDSLRGLVTGLLISTCVLASTERERERTRGKTKAGEEMAVNTAVK